MLRAGIAGESQQVFIVIRIVARGNCVALHHQSISISSVYIPDWKPLDILYLNKTEVSGIKSSQMFLILLLPAVGAGEVDGEVEDGAVEVEVDLEVSAVPAEKKISA